MGKYFGTDGFRGEANVNLTVEHAYKVGRFLGWYYGKNHEDGKAKVVIGKDTRRSSYMFEYSLVAGLTASGADAYLLHVTTTPSVSYVVRTEDFDCGIMISASHNPFYDNGIKLINDKGEKMREDVIDEIEKYLDGDMAELPFATKEKIGCTVDYTAGRNRYMGYLMSLAIYPQVLKNVRVTDKTQAQNDADVRAMVERAAKELGTDGRILVRESGTEPLVRVMVEAGNVETCEKYVDAVIDVIRSKGYVIE